MADTLQIKRRALGGAAGAPSTLAVGELAYNEQDGGLYIGRSNGSIVQVNVGGGFADAPAGSVYYGRYNNTWQRVLPESNGTGLGTFSVLYANGADGVQLSGSTLNSPFAGNSYVDAYGSDSFIHLNLRSKSTGSVFLWANGAKQAEAAGIATTNCWPQFGGGSGSCSLKPSSGTLSIANADLGACLANTAAASDNTARIATTSFVHAAIKNDMDALSTFRATLSADQTGIPQNSFTKINFNTAGINVGSNFNTSNGRWTPPAGRVMLGATLYGNVGAAANLYAAIYKNGAAAAYVFQNSGSNSITYASVSWIDVANGTDFYECYTLQNGPAGAIVYSTAGQTWFYGARF